MSQCTKEPCPHRPAIQEGITENPKKEEKEKIGKKTNPKKHKQEKENTKESHT